MIEEDDESYGKKLKATKNAVYLDIYRIYAGKKIEYSKEAYRAGYEKEDDLARFLCPGNILMSGQYTAHLTFQILYLICILLVNVGILKLYPGFPQENCLKIRKEGNDMFSKKEKIGTTLSLILSLCLMLTGVFFGLPAIGSFAAANDVTYDENGKNPKIVFYSSENGVEPTVTILDDMGNIIPAGEYTYSFSDNTTPGMATVTINDVVGGNYDISTKTESFQILSASNGTDLTDNNPSIMKPGDKIEAAKIRGSYTSNGTAGDDIASTDIHLCEVGKWEGHESKNNSNLVSEITIPSDYRNPSFSYYIVITNDNIAADASTSGGTGYYAYKRKVTTSENPTGFDENRWYDYYDDITNITWKYKLNKDGDVVGLFTESDANSLIKSGVLCIPAKINDRTVVMIGGKYDDGEYKTVVPTSTGSWTGISFPSTVTTINDYAFSNIPVNAKIVIPTTITKIGVGAFSGSKITEIKISEMNGTIGSCAFSNLNDLTSIYIKGGAGRYAGDNDQVGTGLLVSTVAFADTNASTITIKGNVTLNEQAFAGSSKVTSLTFAPDTDNSGITVGKESFKNAALLNKLYIPKGVVLGVNAFDGAEKLETLESDINLTHQAFSNNGSIKDIILDENVASVAYDWEGNYGKGITRTIYVKNPATLFETYTDGSDYYSSFGADNDQVTVKYSGGDYDSEKTSSNGLLSLNARTYHGRTDDDTRALITANSSTSVIFREITENTIAKEITNDTKNSVKADMEAATQTGIDAFYTDKVLTGKTIENGKMYVSKIYDSDERGTYNADEYYIVRREDFKKAVEDSESSGGAVTEETVKKLTPVTAAESDLGADKQTGTVTVRVVVFDENAVNGYYTCDVAVRVEKYTAKSDIEQAYGSYDAIAKRLAALDKQIGDLNDALGATTGSAEEVSKLTAEIANLKKDYAVAVEELKAYTENNKTTDNYGYVGKEKINGEEKDVIYIEGNPTPYTDTNTQDTEGNEIYEVVYDINGDGIKDPETETIYVVIKSDGVHQVTYQDNGDGTKTVVPVTNKGSEIIWKDTLAALQRQMTASLAAAQVKINDLSGALNDIIKTINGNGKITIDPSLPIDEQTLAIINEINRLYDAEAELDAINTGKYTDALNTIYSKLAGKNFTEEELGDLDNVLNTINAQIEKDKTEIESSKATIEDIKEALSDSEARSEELKQKIDENAEAITAKETEIKNKDAAIATANKELETLRNQLDEATDPETIATLNGKIELKEAEITSLTNDKAALENEKTALKAKAATLAQAQNTLATLQGKIAEKDAQITQLQADLAATGATAQAYSETVRTAGELFKTTDDARIAEAIRNYVSANATMSTTIGKIQQAVNSTNNGDALVADINAAIAGAGSGSGTAVPDEATLTAKYNEGYAAGLAASTTATEKEKLDAEYTKGYNAGYAAAPKTSTTDTTSLNAKYNEGYNAGYTAGLKAGSGTGNTELTTQVTSLTSQVTSLTTENTKLAGQVSTLKTDNAALKTELDSLKTNNTELSGKVNDLTTNNTELTGKVDDLTGKNQSLSGQVNDLTTRNNDLAGQITSLNGQVATLKANNNRTTNTGTGNTTANTANTNTGTNANTGTNTTRPTNVTSAANTNNGTTNNGTTTPAANSQSTAGRTSGTSAISAATSSAGRTSATSSATSASPLYGNLSSTPSTGADARSIKITQFENAGTAPASGQVATVNLVKLANADTKGIKTNAMKSAPITDADKEEAEIVINYYMNHLSELGSLGSTEISNAAKDDTKDVAFNEVLAADFTASDAQNKEITEKGKTSLTIASDDIVNGGTYLAIHKSNKRSGMYDVLLTKASGNEIAMTLQDLSPVTIVEVSVAPIGGTAAVTDKSVTETAPAKNMSKLWIAIGICAAVVGAFIFLMVLIKMKGKKRDKMEPAYAGDGNGDFEEVDDQYEDDYEDDPEPYDDQNQG